MFCSVCSLTFLPAAFMTITASYIGSFNLLQQTDTQMFFNYKMPNENVANPAISKLMSLNLRVVMFTIYIFSPKLF